jgi:hypothetical protein
MAGFTIGFVPDSIERTPKGPEKFADICHFLLKTDLPVHL